MAAVGRKALGGIAALLAGSPLLLGATGLTSNAEQRLLASQNRERAALGVPPLAWDERLAGTARIWADHLAATNDFAHAPENKNHPEGENLWRGTRNFYSIEAMVNGWTREKRYFKPGLFPNNSVTGRVGDVGHYTQLMWRQTGEVGCAMATGYDNDILVCRYSAAGNYLGEVPF